jgi:hypothetical protein
VCYQFLFLFLNKQTNTNNNNDNNNNNNNNYNYNNKLVKLGNKQPSNQPPVGSYGSDKAKEGGLMLVTVSSSMSHYSFTYACAWSKAFSIKPFGEAGTQGEPRMQQAKLGTPAFAPKAPLAPDAEAAYYLLRTLSARARI